MSIFHYRAKRKSGETVYGEIEASNQEEAVELINRQDLLPVSIEDKDVTVSSKQRPPKQGRVAAREVFLLTHQLANLIKSGIPILRALVLLSRQTRNGYFQFILSNIERGIKDGKTFSACLLVYPKIFNPFYVAMIKTGEESGSLKEILIRLAEHLRRQEEISSKVRGALAYPALMALVGMGTIIFILMFVMPRIINLFSSAGEELPLATKILIGISTGLREGWVVILAGLIAAGVLFLRWSSSAAGRRAISRAKLKFPLYGVFVLKVELAYFCRTLGLLLKSGVPIVKGLQIAIPVLGNEMIKEDFVNCQKDLVSGASFADGFRSSKLVPVMMTDLIVVGEESGLLEEVLSDVATSYEQETNETIKTLTTLLEPLMILIVGSVVGFIVIAMLLPIFQIDAIVR